MSWENTLLKEVKGNRRVAKEDISYYVRLLDNFKEEIENCFDYNSIEEVIKSFVGILTKYNPPEYAKTHGEDKEELQ